MEIDIYVVFFHISSIDDPLKKNATIGFINNFGQIPKQLFKKPHPSKKMASFKHSVIDPSPMLSAPLSVPPDKLFFYNLDNLKPSLQPIKGKLLSTFAFSRRPTQLFFHGS
jgi:WD repeat and FYVE domain-containing protein 3